MPTTKERPVMLNPTIMDTDSHEPTTVGFCIEDGRFSNLILETNTVYTIEYPAPVIYSETSIIAKAKGKFEIIDGEPWLTDATVWYADKRERSGGDFYISIMEGVVVKNETKKEETTVLFVH